MPRIWEESARAEGKRTGSDCWNYTDLEEIASEGVITDGCELYTPADRYNWKDFCDSWEEWEDYCDEYNAEHSVKVSAEEIERIFDAVERILIENESTLSNMGVMDDVGGLVWFSFRVRRENELIDLLLTVMRSSPDDNDGISYYRNLELYMASRSSVSADQTPVIFVDEIFDI